MKKTAPDPEELIAPCGMNCAVCSRYLACVNDLKRSGCAGCRPGNRLCSYLFAKCSGINAALEGNANARFCFECEQYPCKGIDRMDARYRKNYAMSVKDNLDHIREKGIEDFIEDQYRQHHCSKCGGMISVHNGKCFACDRVTRLIEKRDKQY